MGITKDIIEAEFRTRGGSQVQRDMAEVQKNIALISHENERLRVTKAKLEAQNKKGSKEWKSVTARIKENNKQLGTNKAKLKVLESQMKITDMTAKQLTNHYQDLSRKISKVNKDLHPERWNRLNKELQETDRQMTKVGAKTNKAKNSMSSIKGIASTFLPIAGIAGFVSLLQRGTTELLTLTRTMQGDAVRSTTVFGDQLGYVASEAKKVADRMGLTNREFVANAAATADLLIPLDFSREAAAKMSVELQQLTGALDEWTGGKYGAAEVSNILTKAMLGENEQLKQLGIAIQMDSKEFKDLVKVKKAAGNVTEAQAKAMATLELITKKSADAQAAYNQEGNKLLRMQKQMSLWWKNIKEGVVEYFSASKAEQLEQQRVRVNLLTAELMQHNTESDRRKEIVTELQKLAPDIVASLDAEMKATKKTREELEKYNDEMINKIALAHKDQAISDALDEAGKKRFKRIENERKALEFLNEVIRFSGDAFGEALKKAQDEGKNTVEQLQVLQTEMSKKTGYYHDEPTVRRYIASINDAVEAEKEATEVVKGLQQEKSEWLKLAFNGKDPDKPDSTADPNPEKAKYDPKDELKKLEEAHKKIQNELKRALLAREMTEAEYHGASLAQELNYLEQKKTLTALANESIVDIEGQIYDKRLQMQKEYQSMLDQMRKDAQEIAKDVAQSEKDQELDLLKLDESEMNRILDELNDAKRAANELNLLRAETPEEYRDVSVDQENEAYLEEKRAMEAYELEHQVNLSTQKELLHEQHNLRLKEIDQQYLDERLRMQERYVGQINAFANAIGNSYQAVAGMFEAAKERELAAAGKSEGKKAEIRKKYAQKEQRAAIGMAFINGATAIMNVWAKNTMPYPAAAIYNAIQTAAIGITTAAQIGKISSQQFYTGGYTGPGGKYEPKGVVHAREFVGAMEAVDNPTVKPFFDIIDVAQKNGTIRTLDLNGVMASKAQAAGATNQAQNASSTPTIITRESPETMAILQRTTEVLDRLERNGVTGKWDWKNYKEGKAEMETLERDVGV